MVSLALAFVGTLPPFSSKATLPPSQALPYTFFLFPWVVSCGTQI
jgi:hypothetical protein